MSDVTIWHNPRCSKSRTTLKLLQEHGIDPVIVDYLKSPPTAAELEAVLEKLDMQPAQLLRTGESHYKEQLRGKELSHAQLIEAMVAHPILIERPVVLTNDAAAIGRPPESVLALFD